MFSCLVRQEPCSLQELAQLLKKDYANVWRDARALEKMGIIQLKKPKEAKEPNLKQIQPFTLYDKITFDFSLTKQEREKMPVSRDAYLGV